MSPDSVGGPSSSDAASRASGLMAGRRGLIMGVANDRSIAWGIAKACHAAGAELAFTYQGDVFGQRVKPLVSKIGAKLVLPADVEDDASLDTLFDTLKTEWGRLDFVVHAIAYSDKAELRGRYADTSRENFVRTMLISCFSFTEISRMAAALMPAGGSILTLSYGGSSRVMPNYNVMGVAKAALEASVRYLAADFGQSRIRVNAISAGPIRTLAGAGVANARLMFGYQRANAPLRHDITIEDIGSAALYLLSDLSSAVTGENHYVDCGFNVIGMPRKETMDAIVGGSAE
jgi:enoyl-[acyl-carrier protein] reductase I